ncbi:MAG: HesA/MoeB/ThiF family protein [Bacteroidetes bacterium]|nr:HesA/MoeB/ThiF family protein [Bacteroidota bacterium]HET6243477.1 HesA/MoeB/ThiF family protein [Bacteroidia bacterium]
MLSPSENKRYNRHLILPVIGLKGQLKLKEAKILMVGAGGLGCPVLQYLTAAGVGNIGIVDNDIVDESNLQRQILFTPGDIGKSKAVAAKDILINQNPHINIYAFNEFINVDNAISLISQFDIIIDGTDNFNSRYLINDACIIADKPLVFGSIHQFEGQMSVFNYKNGPTYRCLYPEVPQLGNDCSQAGVIGVLPGIIGTLMANEAIKMIVEIGEIQSGKLFVINALDLQIQVLEFTRSSLAKVTQLGNYNHTCETAQVKEITVAQLKVKITSGEDFQLLDLREIYEQQNRLPKSESLSFGEIMQEYKKIKTHVPVILFCKQGNRSKIAIMNLQEKFGFDNLHNLEGGADAWKE